MKPQSRKGLKGEILYDQKKVDGVSIYFFEIVFERLVPKDTAVSVCIT
jgi:hypothetical protein